MPKHITIEKRVGYTPLQELEDLKRARPALAQVALTYAGRLDPMASGTLLVLVGDECKRRGEYDSLDKEYEFEVLLGATSDTGDVLGLVKKVASSERSLSFDTASFIGVRVLPYPAFSSKAVQGKPLFAYALEGTLDTIDIPTVKTTIYSLTHLGTRTITRDALIAETIAKINLLNIADNTGTFATDFRKDAIIARWQDVRDDLPEQCTILRFRAVVSSGTYIRTLASIMAERLGTVGLAYSIHRTRIGRYQPLTWYFGWWRKVF